MGYPCFHCDVELVPAAKYCHHCGAPVLLAGGKRPVEAAVDEEERMRIKRDVAQAAMTPPTTRGFQAVLAPPREVRRRPPAPPAWQRVVRLRLWRRPWFWIGAVTGALAIAAWTVIHDVGEKSREQGAVHAIVTRLGAACPQNSRSELIEMIQRIQKGAGQESLVDSATVFLYVTRGVSIPDGNCARVADALARPDRFQILLHR